MDRSINTPIADRIAALSAGPAPAFLVLYMHGPDSLPADCGRVELFPGVIGMAPIFGSRAAAERAYPGAAIIEIGARQRAA